MFTFISISVCTYAYIYIYVPIYIYIYMYIYIWPHVDPQALEGHWVLAQFFLCSMKGAHLRPSAVTKSTMVARP